MIKLWTWKPLEMSVYYCKSLEAAAELIDTKIAAYEDSWNESIRRDNIAIDEKNRKVTAEGLKFKKHKELALSLDEILDVFTAFDLELNKSLLEHYRSRHGKPSSNYKKDETTGQLA